MDDAFMTHAENPPHCDHSWIHHHQARAVVSVRICNNCQRIDADDLNEQISMLQMVAVHNALKETSNG